MRQAGGVGFVPVSVDIVPFDYCEAAGAAATRSVSENPDTKFEFAVQDAIKTSQAKAPPTRDTFARRLMMMFMCGKEKQNPVSRILIPTESGTRKVSLERGS